jgi:hypothetical protein
VDLTGEDVRSLKFARLRWRGQMFWINNIKEFVEQARDGNINAH